MTNNRYGIVFPGQGSQSVGMLKDVAAQHKEVKQTFDEASDVLKYDLWQLVQQGPATELDKTIHTQPALLVGSYSIWRILQSQYHIQPMLMAGHSLGEYTGLLCANSLSFSDAIKLVAARAQFMQEAVPEGLGAMVAIVGLDDEIIRHICQEACVSPEEVLTPANFNSIGQVVVAGHRTAVLRLIDLARAKGAKLTVMLPVSVPSHCILMKPAADRLKQMLETMPIKASFIPVINNVDVMPYETPESVRDGLVRQLTMPVRWVETIQYFAKNHVTHIIECGPGKVLTGLNKRIDKGLQLMTTADLADLETLKNVA